GTFTTRQHLGSGYFAFAQNAPFGNLINLTNVSISNPWANYAGGNPFPVVLSRNVVFPTFGSYRTDPFGYKPVTLNQWNLSLQKQIGADWLVSANYVGNSTIHLANHSGRFEVRVLGITDENHFEYRGRFDDAYGGLAVFRRSAGCLGNSSFHAGFLWCKLAAVPKDLP
ncbi:MAG TPA: hypothetical protein VE422_16185, partial [Terriglobia bacterium]|nr:hypothetical protein [Terriglobia bacterium]